MIGKYFIQMLFILTHPSFWDIANPPDKDFDKVLNKLLDEGEEVVTIDRNYARIGPYVLWYENYPYNSYNLKGDNKLSPFRYTRYRLEKSRKQTLAKKLYSKI